MMLLTTMPAIIPDFFLSVMNAIVIEDHAAHALIAQRLLVQVGFNQVIIYSTAQTGLDGAKQQLAWEQGEAPRLVMLDWALPHSYSPSLKANVIAAELLRAMDNDEIQAAHLVVLSYDPQPDCYADAQALGCVLVLAKPFTLEKAHDVWWIAQQPVAPLTASQRDFGRQMLRFSQPVLELLAHTASTSTGFQWDVGQVKHFLQAASRLDVAPAMQTWLDQHGGFENIQAFIRGLELRDPELQRVKVQLVREPLAHWETYTHQLTLSKSVFFVLRRKVFEAIASELNRLG